MGEAGWKISGVGDGAIRAVVALAGLILLATSVAEAQEDTPSAELLNAVRAGDDSRALRLLGEPTTPQLRYLRGRILERSGASAEAAAVFAEDMPELVAREVARRRALLLAKLDRCTEALSALEGITGRAARYERARCTARVAQTDDDKRSAVAVLRREIGRTDGARRYTLRLLLAGLLPDEAVAIRRRAAMDAPLDSRVDLSSFEWSDQERLSIARSLLEADRPARALTLLEGHQPLRALRADWLHTLGMSLYRVRTRYEDAARVLRQAWRAGGATAIDDRFHAARALSRADRDREAIAAYDAFVRASPRHARARQAAYLAAWLELRIAPVRGRRRMERFVRSRYARGRYRRDASWHLGLAALDRGAYSDADGYFRTYARSAQGEDRDAVVVRARGTYWRGRAEDGAGRERRARQRYQEASELDPLGWYGLWACERLGTDGCPGLGTPDEASPPLNTRLPARVRLYGELGLHEDAYDALRSAERSIRARAPRGRANEAVVAAYVAAGAPRRAYRLASYERTRLHQAPRGDARWAWSAAYPRPYWDHVRSESTRRSVPWEQVYATMRQESGFHVQARSHAGALGLLQVMPETAARYEHSLEPHALLDPATNIRLGVREIATVNRSFSSTPLAVAAYNAGVARVRRWLREQEGAELDLFVEKIPFDETRRYVRRVVGHMAHYRYLHTGRRFRLNPDISAQRTNE